jgi:hypothetical protein
MSILVFLLPNSNWKFHSHFVIKPCSLVDNNNLSGSLPPEFAAAPALKILYVHLFSF